MKRMVLIASRSLESEIMNTLEENINEFNSNIFPQKYGNGKVNYRSDTAASREMLFILVSYLDDEDAIKARKAIYTVKKHFPCEAIKLYFIDTQKENKSYGIYRKQINEFA